MEKEIIQIVNEHPEIKLAILFGSQVTGSVRTDSDVDLALLANTPLTTKFKVQLIEELAVKLGRPVDIIDLFYAPEPILGQVFRGKRLLGSDTTYAGLLTRHLLNRADFLPLRQRILNERRDAWTG